MENAGGNVTELILSENFMKKDMKVIFLCGKGNNGGDGFVTARLLKQSGFSNIKIFTFSGPEIKPGAAKDNFNKINNAGFDICPLADFMRVDDIPEDSIVVDALFGTGFKGDLDREARLVGEKVNRYGIRVYAVDVPSGLNATTGQVSKGCIKAAKTITFGLPKKGFYTQEGSSVCGEIIVADIGFPEELIKEYIS
jgi:NAD(P)H-hydrate epimerase